MFVFQFSDPPANNAQDRRRLLGGKGAGLVEMTVELGLAVPPGFVITTEAHHEYQRRGDIDFLRDELLDAVCRLEVRTGRRLGDPERPLVVSVRSGAPVSMPGMMDTILNLGLTDATTRGLARLTNREFADECQRRFDKMFSEIVLGAEDANTKEVPSDAWDQLGLAIEAVFRSWNSPRAVSYRQAEGIPETLGTAVTVQTMVFGNAGLDSGTGVVFSRDPSTGERVLFGDYLPNAQGEDVVAGTHETMPLVGMAEVAPAAYADLVEVVERLERHTGEMCDVEFTVQRGKLWILQTRAGKRSPRAAFQIAVDMATDESFPLERGEAVRRVTPAQLEHVLGSTHTASDVAPKVVGLGASPGTASGRVYFTADDAVDAVDRGEAVVLVRPETSPADVHGMQVAEGILTSIGGLASHAAVVARGWGIPAVVGATELVIEDGHATAGGRRILEGDVISIDGSTGEVYLDEVDLRQADVPECVDEIIDWAVDLLEANGSHPGPDAGPAELLSAVHAMAD